MNRISLLINTCLLLISCSGEQQNNAPQVIRYNASNGITSLDPAFASNQDNIWAVTQIFDGLVSLDNLLKPVAALAENWEITDSGKTYVFHLKKGVFFHHNPIFGKSPRTVSASDFVYSFERLRDPATASPGAWIFGDKLAANAFEAPDSHTLIIRLKAPFAPFLSILAMPYCSVVPREIVETLGKDFGRHPVGTGPFKFHLWEDQVKLILHKNPDYYESTPAKPVPVVDALSVSFIRSRESAFMEFLQGKLDFVGEIDPAFRSKILNTEGRLTEKYRGDLDLHRSSFLNTEYLAILQKTDAGSPLNHPEFRKALNLAIDKTRMIRFLRSGIGNPASGSIVPPGLPGATSDSTRYNPQKALELLALVDQNIRNLEITLTTTRDYEDLCIYMQNQWTAVGIRCRIEVLPSSSLKDAKRNGKLSFFRASWIADYADAENYLSCFLSSNFTPNGPNYTFFSSEDYDRLYQLAISATDEDQRLKYYRTMDKMLIDHGVIVPLYYDESVWVSRNLINVQTSPLNVPKFKYIGTR